MRCDSLARTPTVALRAQKQRTGHAAGGGRRAASSSSFGGPALGRSPSLGTLTRALLPTRRFFLNLSHKTSIVHLSSISLPILPLTHFSFLCALPVRIPAHIQANCSLKPPVTTYLPQRCDSTPWLLRYHLYPISATNTPSTSLSSTPPSTPRVLFLQRPSYH